MPTQEKEKTGQRFLEAKQQYSVAVLAAMRGDEDAERLIAKALAELDAARAEMRGEA